MIDKGISNAQASLALNLNKREIKALLRGDLAVTPQLAWTIQCMMNDVSKEREEDAVATTRTHGVPDNTHEIERISNENDWVY